MSVRILVVDDDRAVRESLRRSLSFNGYSVELAHDGVEALDMIASDRPDALVLDVMMPRLDGLEVCRQLRSTGDDLPILVLTARDSVSERVAGLDAGADDYLPKPFALEELLARMRAAAPHQARGCRRVDGHEVLRPDAGPGNPRSQPWTAPDQPDPHRICIAGDADRQSAASADAQPYPGRGMGIRLSHLGQRAGSLRRVSTPQDRGRRRAAADPHCARVGYVLRETPP